MNTKKRDGDFDGERIGSVGEYSGSTEFYALIRIDPNLRMTEILECSTMLPWIESQMHSRARSNNPIVRTLKVVKLRVAEVIDEQREERIS